MIALVVKPQKMNEEEGNTYKFYTLNPYYNSDKELFGLTIRGKAIEYKSA